MSDSATKRIRAKSSKAPLTLAALLCVLLASGYVYSLITSTQQHPARSGRFAALRDHNGHLFANDARSGYYKLMVFGYSNCPDLCPTTLLKLHEVLIVLGPERARIAPLFVTVDPQRDTPSVLAQYTTAFDPRILGITGSAHDLRALADAYLVFPGGRDTRAGSDLPAHSAMIYLLDRDNTLLGIYGPADPARSIAADVVLRTNHMARVGAPGNEPI